MRTGAEEGDTGAWFRVGIQAVWLPGRGQQSSARRSLPQAGRRLDRHPDRALPDQHPQRTLSCANCTAETASSSPARRGARRAPAPSPSTRTPPQCCALTRNGTVSTGSCSPCRRPAAQPRTPLLPDPRLQRPDQPPAGPFPRPPPWRGQPRPRRRRRPQGRPGHARPRQHRTDRPTPPSFPNRTSGRRRHRRAHPRRRAGRPRHPPTAAPRVPPAAGTRTDRTTSSRVKTQLSTCATALRRQWGRPTRPPPQPPPDPTRRKAAHPEG